MPIPMTNISSNCKMNEQQLEQLKFNYAQMIVDGMDMDTLITLAVESIEQNIKDWDEDDVKGEIVEYYGEDTLNDLLPKPTISELELTASDYGVGK
jgi:hypothetical protein